MTQTLRREGKLKIFEILEKWYQDNPPTTEASDYNMERAEEIIDAILKVSGIAKQAEYKVSDPMWDLFHGKEIDTTISKEIESVHNVAIRLETGLRLGNFPETTAAQVVYKWILRKEAEGENLEIFIKWAMEDKRREFAFIYHKDTNLIKRDWPRAFELPENIKKVRSVPATLGRGK